MYGYDLENKRSCHAGGPELVDISAPTAFSNAWGYPHR